MPYHRLAEGTFPNISLQRLANIKNADFHLSAVSAHGGISMVSARAWNITGHPLKAGITSNLAS